MVDLDKWVKMDDQEYMALLMESHRTGAVQSGITSTTTVTPIRPKEPWLKVFAPPQYQDVSLYTYRVTKGNRRMFETVKGWVERFGKHTKKGLLLHGTTGVGKTHLAYSIGDALSEKGEWPYFINWVEFLADIKKCWKNEYLHEGNIKAPVLNNRVVILDDLGAELIGRGDQGWVSELFYEIVRIRSEHQRPTIVTSNLNLDVMSQRYTDRATSRLVDMCRPVWCQAEDYRVQRLEG